MKRLGWILFATMLASTDTATAQRGRVLTDTVRAASLQNRIGGRAQTEVSVYLPPSYGVARGRRYPVVYLLHGAGNTNRSWLGSATWDGVPAIMDSLIARRAVQEMIVVMPNANNRLGASWYLNSSTSGRWEDFISRDLVAWTDVRFRTLARPESRGLGGASMGGFGALMIAMRHGDPFSAVYSASTCCTDRLEIFDPGRDRVAWEAVATARTFAEVARASARTRTFVSLATAFIPDSSAPPLYFSFPFVRADSGWFPNPAVLARWDANVPMRILTSRAGALRRLRALQLDHGRRDEGVPLRDALAFDSALTRAGIRHAFDVYDGGHFDDPAERLAGHIFLFFSRALDGTQPKR